MAWKFIWVYYNIWQNRVRAWQRVVKVINMAQENNRVINVLKALFRNRKVLDFEINKEKNKL